MRPDVHAAALRSAAKLVLGMASFAVVGCSSEAADDTGVSNDAVIAKDGDAKPETTKTNANEEGPVLIVGLGGTGEDTSKACKATLSSAFPTPGDYQWEPVAVSAEVASCCGEELTKHGSATPYRWDCCVAYDENAKVEKDEDGNVIPWSAPTGMQTGHAWACTPWGPPVPPKMRRSKKMSPRRRDMNQFLVSQLEAQLAQVA